LDNGERTPLLNILKKHYLDESAGPARIERLDGHDINSLNYKVSFERTGAESFHLKALRNYTEETFVRIKFFHECCSKGVRVAPLIPTKRAELFIEEDQCVFVCTRYYDDEGYTWRIEERQSAAHGLAQLNRILASQTASLPRNSLYTLLSAAELETIKKKIQPLSSFENLVAHNLDSLSELGARLREQSVCTPTGYRLEHIDYHPANLIFRGHQLDAILDFDSICEVPRYQSTAFACDRLSRNSDEALEFIRAYREIDADLSSQELLCFPDLVRAEALARISFILRTHFFSGASQWNFELSKHLAIIEKMDAMQHSFSDNVRCFD